MAYHRNNDSAEARKSKNTPKIILAVVFALLIAGIVLFFTVISPAIKKRQILKQLLPQNVLCEDANYRYSIVLYADQSMLWIGEENAIRFTVRIYGDLMEAAASESTILIVDEAGMTLCEINREDCFSEEDATVPALKDALAEVNAMAEEKATDHTEYSCNYVIHPESGTPIRCYAKLGNYVSEPLLLYATGHVTDEMVTELAELSYDLGQWVNEEKLETQEPESILTHVQSWLSADPRVDHAVINGESVLYQTVDHLVGAYLLPRSEETFGTSQGFQSSEGEQVGQAFAREYQADLLTQEASSPQYFDGQNSITNNMALVLSPANLDGKGVDESYENYLKTLNQYSSELDRGLVIVAKKDQSAAQELIDGNLTNYGIVNLICHGSYLKNSDGSYTNGYVLGCFIPNDSKKTYTEAVCKSLNKKYGLDVSTKNARLLYGSIDVPESLLFLIQSDGSIFITNQYMRVVYQNRFFDNTILYFGSCYGLLGEGMSDFYLNHGAKAVIGWYTAALQGAEQSTYRSIFKELLKRHKDGTHSSIQKVSDGAWADIQEAIGMAVDTYVDEVIDWYNMFKNRSNILTMPKLFEADGSFTGMSAQIVYRDPEFTLEAKSTLQGTVLMKQTYALRSINGIWTYNNKTEPGKGINIESNLFLNQTFLGYSSKGTVTDQKGAFSISDLFWGVQGFRLDGKNIETSYAGTVPAQNHLDGSNIYVPCWGSSYSGIYRMIDPSMLEKDENGHILTSAEEMFALSTPPTGKFTANFHLVSADDEKDQHVVGSAYAASVDAEGRFSCENLPGGTYLLELTSAEGSTQVTLNLKNGWHYTDEQPIYLTGMSYYQYIHEFLEPVYGLSELSEHSQLVTLSSHMALFSWDERSGIVSADIADLDSNGVDDLVVYRIQRGNAPGYTQEVNLLYAELYTRDRGGNVIFVNSLPLIGLPVYDSWEYQVSLVNTTDGKGILAYEILYPQGYTRIFTMGASNEASLFLYGADGLEKAAELVEYSSGDPPYGIVDKRTGFFCDYASMRDVLVKAGICVTEKGAEKMPYFEELLSDSTVTLAYTAHPETQAYYTDTNITTHLTDCTNLRNELAKLK